jgi:hypothetical protein
MFFILCVFIHIPSFLVHDTIFYANIELPGYTRNKRRALAHALLDWGGFATLTPMFSSKSPYNSDQEDVPIENEGMRRVLNMAAQLTGRPDPSFETVQVQDAVDVKEEEDIKKEDIKKEDVKIEEAEEEEEEVLSDKQPAPLRIHSRSWSLPSPSPDSQTSTPPPKRAKATRSVQAKAPAGAATGAGATALQQQILAKIKRAKPSVGEGQRHAAEKVGSVGSGKQNEEWTISKKEARKLPKASAKPESGLKDRIWEVVGKWF